MSDIAIREYIHTDIDEMRRLHQAFGDFIKDILPPEMYKFDAPAEGGFETWLAGTRQPDKRILVADLGDGRLAAYILGTVESEPGQQIAMWGYVDDLFVDEHHRRHGLGGRLMTEMEAWFKSRGCGAVGVDSWLANPEASKAYAAMGFLPDFTGFVREL